MIIVNSAMEGNGYNKMYINSAVRCGESAVLPL